MDEYIGTVYTRCPDQRDRWDWVKAANAKVPQWLREASEKQLLAANLFVTAHALTGRRRAITLELVAEQYAEARRSLFRAMYYNGMREANRN